jgi:cytochrome b6-f complex iron-sulfur subunit
MPFGGALMPELSRRDSLKIARDGFLYLSGALVLGGLLRFLNFQTEPTLPTEFDLGAAENYPLGTKVILPKIPAILSHSEKGFSAISLVCTHLGCTVDKSAEGFACPCHGSRFDEKGVVTHGPANKPLQSLRVEVTDEGNLKIFTINR